MATITEFRSRLELFGGTQLVEGLWAFDLEGQPGAPVHRVTVDYEVNKGGTEYLLVRSVVGRLDDIDLRHAFLQFGQMLNGAFSHAPTNDEQGRQVAGYLMFGTSLPLAALDLTDPLPFLTYLYAVAATASMLGSELVGTAS